MLSSRGFKTRSNPFEIPHYSFVFAQDMPIDYAQDRVRNDTLYQIASRSISIGGVFKPRILLRDKNVPPIRCRLRECVRNDNGNPVAGYRELSNRMRVLMGGIGNK